MGAIFDSRVRQLTMLFVIKIGARHVDQFARLLLNGGHHIRMAMPGRSHGNAGREIKKLVAIHIVTTMPRPLLATSG